MIILFYSFPVQMCPGLRLRQTGSTPTGPATTLLTACPFWSSTAPSSTATTTASSTPGRPMKVRRGHMHQSEALCLVTQ